MHLDQPQEVQLHVEIALTIKVNGQLRTLASLTEHPQLMMGALQAISAQVAASGGVPASWVAHAAVEAMATPPQTKRKTGVLAASPADIAALRRNGVGQ